MAHHKHSKLAAATYFLFFVPNFTDHKEDPFVKYHMHQAIALLIFALVLQGIISLIGVWGFGPSGLRVWPVRIIILYELFMGIRNALEGKMHPLPWIGKYAEKLFS